jgi:hypothetical protein
MQSYFSRQTPRGKNVVWIQSSLDPVHNLPFRPGSAENIISSPEIVRCFQKQSMPDLLVDFFAQVRPVIIA